MKRALAVAAILAGGGLGVAAAMAGCDDGASHIYAARIFEVDRGCLDDYGAVDVVSGGEPSSTCAPVCLTNAGTTYVSKVCPPYPPLFGVESADAASNDTCAAAFAALARGDSCLPDGGGSTHPADGGVEGGADDGGLDAGALGDAASDAPADATPPDAPAPAG